MNKILQISVAILICNFTYSQSKEKSIETRKTIGEIFNTGFTNNNRYQNINCFFTKGTEIIVEENVIEEGFYALSISKPMRTYVYDLRKQYTYQTLKSMMNYFKNDLFELFDQGAILIIGFQYNEKYRTEDDVIKYTQSNYFINISDLKKIKDNFTEENFEKIFLIW